MVIFAICCVLSCGDPPPSQYPTSAVVLHDNTLGVGDVFDVRVFQQKEMSSTYRVSSDGTISFPYIGAMMVVGNTPRQVEELIRTKLADGVLRDPHVSVFVKEYASKKVSIFGQVKKPGTLAYSEGMTIVEAISMAGGFTARAQKNATTVTRTITRKEKSNVRKYTVPVESIGEGKANMFYVRPSDVVFVPQRSW